MLIWWYTTIRIYPQWAGMWCGWYLSCKLHSVKHHKFQLHIYFWIGSIASISGNIPAIPNMVITESNSAGQYFVRIWTRQHQHSDSRSISYVIIHRRRYQGPICNANGQTINLIIGRVMRGIMLFIVWPIPVVLMFFNNTFANPRSFQFSSMRSVITATGSSSNSGDLCQSTLKNPKYKWI